MLGLKAIALNFYKASIRSVLKKNSLIKVLYLLLWMQPESGFAVFHADLTAMTNNIERWFTKSANHFALKSTIDYAFINSNSNLYKVTNTNDPLFISIRMKTSSEDMKTLFDSIQNIIAGISRNVNYQRYFTDRKIDENTILESILGKVILVFEKNDLINLMGKQYNMISNSDKLTKNTYKQINVDRYLACPPKRATDSTVMFNCDHTFNQIVPDTYLSSQNNPNIFSSIKDYGNQVNMFQYYKNDIYLIEYENIFKTYNSAFVPLSYCLSYIDINATPAKMNNVVFPNIIGQLF